LHVAGAVQDARQVSSESHVACVGSREKPVETQIASPVARALAVFIFLWLSSLRAPPCGENLRQAESKENEDSIGE